MDKITINFQNFKSMLWKNGLGTTFEVDIFPPTATMKELNFDFRISMAQVAFDNNFSHFLGMQRFLTVIKGSGIKFNQKILRNLEIIQFRGEESVASGPIIAGEENLDLGVIYNSKNVSCEMKKFEILIDEKIKVDHQFNYFFQIKTEGAIDCLKIVLDPNEAEAMINLPLGIWIYIAIKPD